MRFGPHSEETKRKMSLAHLGKPHSEERIRNMKLGVMKKIVIPKDELIRLYIGEAWTQKAIAQHFGVHWRTVAKRIHGYGIVLSEEQCAKRIQGTRHVHYKTGVLISNGYRMVLSRGHPGVTLGKRVCEHRLVVESFIGRFLTASERVHHVNHIKSDNRIENFILFADDKEHATFHNWMEQVGLFSLAIIDKCPSPLKYEHPVLFRGKWVNEISTASFWAEPIKAVA